MSARKGDPNAAVASVGFDKLPVKSFEKKKIKEQIFRQVYNELISNESRKTGIKF